MVGDKSGPGGRVRKMGRVRKKTILREHTLGNILAESGSRGIPRTESREYVPGGEIIPDQFPIVGKKLGVM